MNGLPDANTSLATGRALYLLVVGWALTTGGLLGQSDTTATFLPYDQVDLPAPALQRPVSLTVGGRTLKEALLLIAENADLSLSFRADLLGMDDVVAPVLRTAPVGQVLHDILRSANLRLLVDPAGRAVVLPAGISDPRLGRVAGVVLEATSGRPVVGVQVRMIAAGGQAWSTISGADGDFAFDDVAPGSPVLEASRIGLEAVVGVQVAVTAGRVARPVVEMNVLPTTLAEMVVTPGVFSLLQRAPTSSSVVSRSEIEMAPQLGEDIYRIAQSIPGVATPDLSVRLNVRGSRDDALMVRLDGIQLYEPYHLGDFDGALSIIDVESIEGMKLHAGGFPAELGDRSGGVLELSSDSGVGATNSSALGLTVGGLRGRVVRSFGSGRGQWSLAARRAYVDLILSMVGEADQVNPRYSDVFGKVSYDFGPRLWIAAQGLFAGDRFFLDDDQDNDLDSDWRSLYGWLRTGSAFGPVHVETVVSLGGLNRSRFGAGPPTSTGRRDLLVSDVRDFDFAGIRQDWSVNVTPDLMVKWGYEHRDVSAKYDYQSHTARSSTVEEPEGLTLVETVDTTALKAGASGVQQAGYLSARARGGRLVAEIGVRADKQSYTGRSQLTPRTSAAFAVTSSTRLRAAWGRYAQAQGVHELQVQDGDDRFFEAEEASGWVAGVEQSLGGTVVARVEGYRRRIDRPLPFYFDQDQSGVNAFPETSEYRTLLAPDIGRASGLEAAVRGGDPMKLLWSGAYTWAVAEHRVRGDWMPLPWDQRHAVSGTLGFRTGSGWRIGAAFQFHTGWPRPTASIAVDTLASGELSTTRTYDQQSWVRLPAYHRLDLRFTRDFVVGRGVLSAFLDVFNAYNRKNPKAFTTTTRVAGGRVDSVTGLDGQLPIIPSFGVRWTF